MPLRTLEPLIKKTLFSLVAMALGLLAVPVLAEGALRLGWVPADFLLSISGPFWL